MRIILIIARLAVGLLFIFSGLIKANDTIGFSYKLDEYFEVFGMEWMRPFSLFISIVMCALEMILGLMLLIGARIKTTLWLLLLMILFFAFLNFYSGYFDKVRECGCFGDAIKMTPWQEFANNMVMLVLTIIMLIKKDDIHPLFGTKVENGVAIVGLIASIGFPLYTYNYLPVIDFRPYAIGKNIPEQTKGIPDELKFFYTLKDKKTGATKEVEKWPENWDQVYDYVSSRTEITKKGIDPKIKDFSITSLDGSDYTQDIIENPNYNFLLICYDLAKTEKDVFGKVNDFAALCKHDSVAFVTLTASTKETIEKFKQEVNTNVDFYNCDGTVLKTMIRSNPGLMLIKGGTVIDMWHYHSFPAYNDVKEKYFKNNANKN
jgi:uncharacterized membrane protein YphA (DoxX/SURF4 family)